MRPALTTPDDLCQVMGIPFSDEQIEAITAPMAPSVIIAGAGTGKTTVMAARVVWLVGRAEVAPERVLGLTFTRKAAQELSSRVRAGLELVGADDAYPRISTYDAFASRLVSEFGAWMGVSSSTRVLTGAERHILADQVVRTLSEPPGTLADKALSTIIAGMLKLEESIQSHLVPDQSIEDYTASFIGDLEQAPLYRGLPYVSITDAEQTARERLDLLRLSQAYRDLKARHSLVEFSDQMAIAVRLAADLPEVGAALRQQYGLVIVDEYQDTSPAQAHLLSRLFGTEAGVEGYPVTAVGDPCQAIYTWRGAAVDNIYSFHDSFGSADRSTYVLSVNRRSGESILAAANAVAADVRADPLVAGQRALPLVASAQAVAAEVVVRQFETADEEADGVAESLADAVRTGIITGWGQAAVLLRRNREIGPIVRACERRGIPVAIQDMGGLLGIEAVSQVYAMIKLITDPASNPEIVEILGGPRFRLGAQDLGLVARRARDLALVRGGLDQEVRLVDAVLDAGDESWVTPSPPIHDYDATGWRHADSSVGAPQTSSLPSRHPPTHRTGTVSLATPAIGGFGVPRLSLGARWALQRLKADLNLLGTHHGTVVDHVRRIVSQIGLDTEIYASQAGCGPHLRQFLSHVADFAATRPDTSLSALAAYLRAEEEFGVGLTQAAPTRPDAVTVMTIHRAKGLEWDCVYLPCLVDRVFPQDRVTDNPLTSPAGLPTALRSDAAAMPQLGQVTNKGLAGFKEELKQALNLSEDRLAYVGLTRARRRLVITAHRRSPASVRPRDLSRYITTIAGLHLGEVSLLDGSDVREEDSRAPGSPGSPGSSGTPLEPADDPRWQESAVAVLRATHGVSTWNCGELPDRAEPESTDPLLLHDPVEARWLVGRRSTDVQSAFTPPADPSHRHSVARDASDRWIRAESEIAEWDERISWLERRATTAKVVDVVVPTPLSTSQLVRIGDSPAEFAARLARPLPHPPSRRTDTGSRFHAWVEQYYTSSPLLQVGDDAPDRSGALATAQQHFLDSSFAAAHPAVIEQDFMTTVGGHPVSGRIDAVFRAEDNPGLVPQGKKVLIVDWKTGTSQGSPTQLAVYARAWAAAAHLSDDEVAAGFYYAATGVFQEVAVAAQIDDILAGVMTAQTSDVPVNVAEPGCTDSWLLRDPVEARWLVGRRSPDVQSAFTPPADPSHPHSVARDASNRCIRAEPGP
ncbi:MAG: ATP-dependent helicase [Propionibacteriaceae bacterium]|nr:ATP-dependent helicase [Propionibacteriaceae bacterium]